MEMQQLLISEFRQDVIGDYNLTGDTDDENQHLALLGSTTEAPMLQLNYEAIAYAQFPYNIDYLPIPQQRPCDKLLKNIDLPTVYANSNVLQSQELALDPIYVSEYSMEPPKAKLQQVQWAPKHIPHVEGSPLIALLTSYGACHINVKQANGRHWCRNIFDLNQQYLEHVFPLPTMLQASNVRKWREFKELVDCYLITAMAWHPNAPLFYTANASGWLVVFQLTPSNTLNEIRLYLKCSTTMGRITYLKAFGDWLLVGNALGVVRLFCLKELQLEKCDELERVKEVEKDKVVEKIQEVETGKVMENDKEMETDEKDKEVEKTEEVKNSKELHKETHALIEVECLWSKADRMSCRRAEVTHSDSTNTYTVVFTKAAHVLVYRLNGAGSILSSCTVYVGGVKITGLASLSVNEFIVCTINGNVKLLRVCTNTPSSDAAGLEVEEQHIATDLDTQNHQLLGMATTLNSSLWLFMLSRNRDYVHQSKHGHDSAFVSVCRLSSVDALQLLSNRNVSGAMNECVDYAVTLRLDIVNGHRPDYYKLWYALQEARFPAEINDAFLQKLQLKYLLVKALGDFEIIKYKTMRHPTIDELQFLERCIPLTHIICRLQRLQAAANTFSDFQKLAAHCLKTKFHLLVRELQALICAENPIKDTVERFAKLMLEIFKKLRCDECSTVVEQCALCQAAILDESMMCAQAHKIRRCCVSFVQIPFFNRNYCKGCNTYALDDETQLREILTPEAAIKCTICRFAFTKAEF